MIANAKHDLSKMANDGEQRQFLSTYQSATLSESNCSSYYELAVEANNESLQVGMQTSRNLWLERERVQDYAKNSKNDRTLKIET